MENCKTCEHAIFDAQWGEYKCEVYKRVTYNANSDVMIVKCGKNYKKGTPKESKINADYEANLLNS